MKTISVQQFCIHYDVPVSFVDSLSNLDLIRIVIIDKTNHIQIEEINRIERLMRMHYELKVNFEGLDVINNLIDQVNSLHEDIEKLKNKIDFYK